MAERWRDVAGYDGIYQVSDLEQVPNTHTSKILQPIKMKNGWMYVTFPATASNQNALRTAYRPYAAPMLTGGVYCR